MFNTPYQHPVLQLEPFAGITEIEKAKKERGGKEGEVERTRTDTWKERESGCCNVWESQTLGTAGKAMTNISSEVRRWTMERTGCVCGGQLLL